MGLDADPIDDSIRNMTSSSIYTEITLPFLSLQGVFLILLLALPAAAVIGFAVGRNRRKAVLAANKDIDLVTGETTLAAILALLGLLLAFSFGNALNLSETRKSAIVDEAAALGTAFLRADYVDEPLRTELKIALFEYTETRVIPGDGSLQSIQAVQGFLDRTLTAQGKLWPLTLKATADPTPPPIKSFVAGAMNDAIDAHLIRMKTLSNPVSEITNSMMLAAALTALFLLGNRAGLVGRSLTWRTYVFSAFLLLVMTTIADTQRGGEGLVRVDQSALKATIFDMQFGLNGAS